jgi:hypothetical protein
VTPAVTRLVVDNSAGGDAAFADEVARGLRDRGFAVDVREPPPGAMFDTGVHFVSTRLAIRVADRPDHSAMAAIEEVVRSALLHRPSRHKRSRAVAVHLGDTSRVITWIEAVG